MTKGRTEQIPILSVNEPTFIVYGWPKVKKGGGNLLNVSDISFNVEDVRERVEYCNTISVISQPCHFCGPSIQGERCLLLAERLLADDGGHCLP